MKFSEYRETYSWQLAMELSPQLLRLAEEMPAAEEMGLSLQLRQIMIDLPAGIATDLLQDRAPQLTDVLRLTTALELIDRVYPALDTAGVRTAADLLAERVINGNFKERVGDPEPAPARLEPPAPIPVPSAVPVLPEATEPTRVQVSTEAQPAE